MKNKVTEELSLTEWSQTYDSIYSDLNASRDLIYNPCQFKCSEPIMDKESIEYVACSFRLNSLQVRFRVAKITPTKIGQFVTLWKRIENGPTQPYDIKDDVDLFVIATRSNDNFGQFVFPKSALLKHGIMSNNGKGGKRGVRVYPSWDITVSKQAKQTQAWQLQYFLEIPKNKPIDCSRAKMLYNSISTFIKL